MRGAAVGEGQSRGGLDAEGELLELVEPRRAGETAVRAA
jgi:hypothetical protein